MTTVQSDTDLNAMRHALKALIAEERPKFKVEIHKTLRTVIVQVAPIKRD
jgi:hypothetical protein